MKKEKVLMRNGIYVSGEIIRRLDRKPIPFSVKEKMKTISEPYDKMQWGKNRNPRRLKPKIISNLSKIENGKSAIDTITKSEYNKMESKLKKIISSWILT